jgi:hypothetical protein
MLPIIKVVKVSFIVIRIIPMQRFDSARLMWFPIQYWRNTVRMHVNDYVGGVTRSAPPGGDEYPRPGPAVLAPSP